MNVAIVQIVLNICKLLQSFSWQSNTITLAHQKKTKMKVATLITSEGFFCNDNAKCHNFRWVFLKFLFLDFSKLMRLSFCVSKRDKFQTFLVHRKKPVNMNPKSSNEKLKEMYMFDNIS